MKIVRESLSPSEAVYGFAGWLTTRDEPVTLSGHHNAAIAAELVDEYVKKQGFEEPRENWHEELVPMNEKFDDCSVDVLDYKKCIEILQEENPNFTFKYTPAEKFRYAYYASVDKDGKYYAGLRGPTKIGEVYEFFKDQVKRSKRMQESLNENMAYIDFFGKKVSHQEALQKRVRDSITQIIMDERGISEKAFSSVDDVMEEVKRVCDENPEIYEIAQEFYDNGKRFEYLAEQMYELYFKREINETMSKAAQKRQDEDKDVKEKVERSKKLSSEMKEKIYPLIVNGQSKYKEGGKVFNLKFNESKNGCSLGADKDGFFVYTHRARSKSYPEVDKIPQKDLKFIESTG